MGKVIEIEEIKHMRNLGKPWISGVNITKW
jgi:hypothetical protein